MKQAELFSAPLAAHVAGVDEAGRGPLAGDVFAAAVILRTGHEIPGLTDSKKLTEHKRVSLASIIREQAIAWCIARATVEEIDKLNILRASLLAMKRAVEGLTVCADLAMVDGNQCPDLACAVQTVVGGDLLVPCISAASILAKTARDEEMMRLHEAYPQYGFDLHKGYGTALHMERLQQHGPCVVHRRSFGPVRRLLETT